MKIQGLAIIFVIIILPITIIIGEYAGVQIDLLKREKLYDSRLITATHDALKAFQINTFNDATSDIANSKIESIEASANAFYNSMESSFGLEGYSKQDLKMYIPALVYTMYDGYYIYSPYTNVADISEGEGLKIDIDSKEIDYGFKPYVYYSCRYVKESEKIDVIINYSLDNYITVQGTIDGEIVYKSGYLLTIDTEEGLCKTVQNGKETYSYNGFTISSESSLVDNLVEKDSNGEIITKSYQYIKLNGTKYYWNDVDGDEYIFYLMGGERRKQVTKLANEDLYNKYVNQIISNKSALTYYRKAYEFSAWVKEKLGNLTLKDAITELQYSGDENDLIFDFENVKIPIEYSKSNFNLHRKEVIRHSIESNLSVAIANFNEYTKVDASNNFQMPKLKETEWELLQNEVSIISFLQGLNMGGKIYNGYTVVTNNKTEEVVKEERIYITTDDNGEDFVADYYHKINDKDLLKQFEEKEIISGVLDLDLEIRKDGATGTNYIPKSQLGCYNCIVGQESVNNKYDCIYEYLQNIDEDKSAVKKIKQLYYTALARERWGTYKVENPTNIENILEEMLPMNNYDIVKDGLIRLYDAKNMDGNGNPGTPSTTIWKDLTGNHDATINGGSTVGSNYVSFDGENDYVNTGYIGDLKTVTLEATIMLREVQSQMVNIMGNTNRGGLALNLTNGIPTFMLRSEEGEEYIRATSNEKLEIGKVYTISGTYDGQKVKLYVNGVLKAEETTSGKIVYSNVIEPMLIGADPMNYAATSGAIAECAKINVYSAKVYNKALNKDEILTNKKATLNNPGSDTSPIIRISDIDGVIDSKYQLPFSGSPLIISKQISATGPREITSLKGIYSTSSAMPADSAEWKDLLLVNVINKQATKTGIYYLHIKAKDNSGNESTVTKEYKVGREINIRVDNADRVSGNSYKIAAGETKVTIAKQIFATTKEGKVTSLKGIYSTSPEIPNDSAKWQNLLVSSVIQNQVTRTGTYYLHIKAVDNNGNETFVTKEYNVTKE